MAEIDGNSGTNRLRRSDIAARRAAQGTPQRAGGTARVSRSQQQGAPAQRPVQGSGVQKPAQSASGQRPAQSASTQRTRQSAQRSSQGSQTQRAARNASTRRRTVGQARPEERKRASGAARQAGSAPAGSKEDLRRRGRALASARRTSVRSVMAVFAFFSLVGLLFFLRPTHSDLEKRDLTPFPEFTFGRLVDGSFFSDLSLWYGDTYPLREPMVRLSQGMNALHGIQPKTQLVGGTVNKDELPVEGADADAAAPAEAVADNEVIEVPTERYMAEEIQSKIMEGLYVNDGAAYNIYYFSQESVEQYARAMNTCAKNLEGQATVYSIIAPTSAGALLDEQTLEDLGGTDQLQAIKYFHSLYDDSVHGINVYNTLRAHNNEYIYYRTDHHWTQLGAYYAYVEFCRDKGVEPSNIFGREKMTFDGFLGTFYSELGNSDMEARPDYVDAYIPNSTNDMVIWDTDGNEIETNVVTDVSDWNMYSKYNCFISGDRPLSRIDNPLKNDGSSCLVIKDSFGCAFVPLLVDDYQTVWVIDFRYSDRSIPDFVRENNIQDVIFLNAIVLAGTDPVSSALLAQSQNG
ncbi:MAG: hypothetical protein IJ781_00695 [Atopobiaceae bacterium]|nr:hypothetical protein [Atopobiaceae bacterium]